MKTKNLQFALLAVLVAGCSVDSKESDKEVIAVSILPQKYFVEQVAGQTYDVHVMVPPGASPETFDPTPRELVKISDAVAYFKIGHIEFEKGWDEKIKSINSELKFYDLSLGIELISGEDHDHGHHHQGVDPHVWMSVRNAGQISKNILVALKELNPEEAATYELNYNRFMSRLDSLDHWIQSQLSEREHDVFLIFHPALTYYARDYGLEQESLEYEGKQPTPQHFRNITEMAREHQINQVFIQKQFDIENAQMLAKEIGAEIVEIDPLSDDWEGEVIAITKKLKNALGK